MSRHRHERPVGGGGDKYDDTVRSSHRSSSPAHKKRAVAADYFDDDDDDNNTQDQRSAHNHHHRHRRDSGRLEHKHREHKRRKHHHDASSSAAKKRHGKTTSVAPPAELPCKARPLSYKHDFAAFEPLFANYLDIQKSKDFYSLDGHERKGRWKSFVNKWNGGELAEGWYDPEMFERFAKEGLAGLGAGGGSWDEPVATDAHSDVEAYNRDGASAESLPRSQGRKDSEDEGDNEEDRSGEEGEREGEGEDDYDDFGPPPPPGTSTSTSIRTRTTPSTSRKGPGIPSLSDLALQRDAAEEARTMHAADLRLARKADRAQQKAALEELVPRAEPGTRERRLEKKAAVNEKMRAFRDKGGADAAVEEMDDGELMGGGDGDSVAAFKRAVASQQRKKTERELRREEEARARREEREEKLREWRAREEDKMKGLKELAKARFG